MDVHLFFIFPWILILCIWENSHLPSSNPTPLLWHFTPQSIREYSCPCMWKGVTGPGQGLGGRCRKRGERERQEPRYLTDNVIIVSQCTGMRDVRRGVAQFPYIWVGALSDGGQREIIIVLLRWRPVLTAGHRMMDGGGYVGWGDGEEDKGQGWGEQRTKEEKMDRN